MGNNGEFFPHGSTHLQAFGLDLFLPADTGGGCLKPGPFSDIIMNLGLNQTVGAPDTIVTAPISKTVQNQDTKIFEPVSTPAQNNITSPVDPTFEQTQVFSPVGVIKFNEALNYNPRCLKRDLNTFWASQLGAHMIPTYYNGCGDNHHLSSRLFKQNVGFAAADPSKQFTTDAMANQYAAIAAFSQKRLRVLPQLLLQRNLRAGGVPNYESISSIVGASYDSETGNFKYVPEKWPENWYRRATPCGAVQTLTDGYLKIYPKYPLLPGVAQFGSSNFNAQTILCDIYQGLNSITPLSVAGETEDVAMGLTCALSKLAPFISSTVLGCSASALSPNIGGYLFPNTTKTGGPLAPPASQNQNLGNSVYNKVYFTSAPTTPQCNHVS
ncbi:hypothetical protein BDV96DRAFT_655416 [Lophiotrema nucula]|uniref:Heme haloperoxidase family profile domain-containing protein n=1 Tax=Lophiotrema nucula TaxID=690887 RepID=A0A6A5YG00_9PLEO|nr:hypothetical protein BDV96DRAFT_655416 [Lophiotrema nucula]